MENKKKLMPVEKKRLDLLVKMGRMYDALSYLAYSKDPIGSLDSIREAHDDIVESYELSSSQQQDLLEIAGTAHLMMLKLDKAYNYFSKLENKEQLSDFLDVALWYGNCPKVVKELSEPEVYSEFLRTKAVSNIPLWRDDEGFYLDQDTADFVMSELNREGLDPKETIEDVILEMEKKGKRNIPIKLALAELTEEKDLINKYIDEYNLKLDEKRRSIERVVKEYAVANGYGVSRMQEGDFDEFFPVAANIYLLEKDDKKIVLKENLKLYTDFSDYGGYNMEKEVYEIFSSPDIIRYRGEIELDGIEFLKFDYFDSTELSEYTQGDLLSLEEAVAVIKKHAGLLEDLHDKGIMYMDVKDKNVLYDRSGDDSEHDQGDISIKVLDFGMAQIFDHAVDGSTIARSLLSTPQYVPPEWAKTFKVHNTSETFQLGVLFYQLIEGKHPFARYDFNEGIRESEMIKFALANAYVPYRKPKSLESHPELEQLLSEMLDKDYTKRPAPGQVKERLNSLYKGV